MILANLASLLPTDASALEASISALESSISALESSIAPIVSTLPFWEYFGFGSALVVVLGVLLELHDIWHRHGEDNTAWALSFFEVSRSLEKPRFIKKYGVEFASVILVAGGVAGEVGAGLMIESKNAALRAIDIKLRSANSELRSKSDQLLALTTAQAGGAEKSAKVANDEVDVLQKKADALKQELADAKSTLAEVEKKRADLEQSLINLAVCNAPRVIPPWTLLGTRDNRFDSLKPFATQAIIEFIPDFEARRAALYVKAILSRAGWTVSGPTSTNDVVDDGVDVQTFVFLGSKDPKERDTLVDAEHRSENAADAVVNFLRLHNWQADRGFPGDAKGHLDTSLMPPPGGLRIRIGLYPAVVYVTPPGDKDLAAAEAKREQQIDASIKEMHDKTDKERLQGLTGKERADLKAKIDSWRARIEAQEKAWRKEHVDSPCQPLNSVFP